MNIASYLQDVGFTANEARVYVSLLTHGIMTGYEIGKATRIQRASVYQVLDKLLERKAIYEVMDGKVKKYVPEKLTIFLSNFRKGMEASISKIEESAASLIVHPEVEDHFVGITSYKDTLEKIRHLVRESKKEIFISGGWQEIREFQDELGAAIKRKVQIRIFSFGQIPLDNCEIHSYGLDEGKIQAGWTHRRLIVVADHLETVLVQSDKNEILYRTLWTKNPLLVSIAYEHIAHDIYILSLKKRLNVQELPEDRIFEDHRNVRKMFLQAMKSNTDAGRKKTK